MPRNRQEPEWRFVYFIAADGLDVVKIGSGDNPERRLRMLQVGSPVRLRILKTMETDDARGWERELHQQFAHLREHGEWFRLGDDLRAYIDRIVHIPDLPPNCGIAYQRKPSPPPLFSVASRPGESTRKFVKRIVEEALKHGMVIQ